MVFRTILIVDSNHDFRSSLRKIFEEVGHFVISTVTGAEAILMLEKLSIPAIVLVASDSIMMSGENFLVGFHAYEKFSKVPAIQIKRTAEERNLDGFSGYIVPPFNSETVLATLKHCN